MSTQPVVTPADDRQPDLAVTDDFGFDESVSLDQLRTQAMTAVATQPKPVQTQPDPTTQPDPDPDPEPEEEEEEEVDDPQSPPREFVQEIDLGDGSGVQVFRGRTKDELIQKLVTAQTNATKKIRELSNKNKPAEPASTALTAEQEFLLGQELLESPSKAFDKIFASKFGMSTAEMQKKLKTVEAVEQERIETEISAQFLSAHPEFHACPQNADRIDRYFKRFNLERTLENLEQVYADLSSDGLLIEGPTSQPQPVGDTNHQPTTERIAQPASGNVAPRKKAASGLSGRRSAPAPVVKQGPTDEELENMPLHELEALARRAVMNPSR